MNKNREDLMKMEEKLRRIAKSREYRKRFTKETKIAIESLISFDFAEADEQEIHREIEDIIKIEERGALLRGFALWDRSSAVIILSNFLRDPSVRDEEDEDLIDIIDLCREISLVTVEEIAHCFENEYYHPKYPQIDQILKISDAFGDYDYLYEKLLHREEIREDFPPAVIIRKGGSLSDEDEEDNELIIELKERGFDPNDFDDDLLDKFDDVDELLDYLDERWL
ncbi:MAG: hypothetical protein ACXQS8_06935 [Candidatus Helarchaeales archaeon]